MLLRLSVIFRNGPDARPGITTIAFRFPSLQRTKRCERGEAVTKTLRMVSLVLPSFSSNAVAPEHVHRSVDFSPREILLANLQISNAAWGEVSVGANSCGLKSTLPRARLILEQVAFGKRKLF